MSMKIFKRGQRLSRWNKETSLKYSTVLLQSQLEGGIRKGVPTCLETQPPFSPIPTLSSPLFWTTKAISFCYFSFVLWTKCQVLPGSKHLHIASPPHRQQHVWTLHLYVLFNTKQNSAPRRDTQASVSWKDCMHTTCQAPSDNTLVD